MSTLQLYHNRVGLWDRGERWIKECDNPCIKILPTPEQVKKQCIDCWLESIPKKEEVKAKMERERKEVALRDARKLQK
jgi:hypothetical protein